MDSSETHRLRYYTDGACSGNPGPGGWAWIVPDGPFGAGPSPDTTNQRMELQAVLEAVVHAKGGPIEIVSDSTYVVNCFKDKWYEGWLKRGWKNSQKKPVANRDLWEPLIDAVLNGGDVKFTWVKGHAGDKWNDYADRLAVEATFTQEPRAGDATPTEIGDADELRGQRAQRVAVPGEVKRDPTGKEPPEGHRLLVMGLRPRELGGYDENPIAERVRMQLIDIIAAKAAMHRDLVVLTGLRLGSEMLAAEAAVAAGARFVAVLPYPDPHKVWPMASQQKFLELTEQAEDVLVLQKKLPEDKQKARGAMARRDSWFGRAAHEAVVVWDHEDAEVGKAVKALEKVLPEEDIWIVQPSTT